MLKRYWPILVVALTCLTSPPAMSSQTGATLRFGAWAVVCDNGWRCEALMANSEANLKSSLSIELVREGGPNGQLRLSVFPGASAADGKSFLPAVIDVSGSENETTKSLPAPHTYDGDRLTFEGETAASLLKTMAEGDSFRLFDRNNRSVTLNTRGLLAVLIYFDTVQRRIGNESALASKGAKPKSATPQPPPLPLITIPRIANEPPRRLTQAKVRQERETFGCEGREPFATTTSGVEYIRLDARTTLALIMPLCPLSNYNSFARIVLIDETGKTRLARIERDNPDAKLAENLVGAYWDETARRLVSFGRGNGLCGSGEVYAWDGTKFRIAEERATASCELEIFKPLTTWRATVAVR